MICRLTISIIRFFYKTMLLTWTSFIWTKSQTVVKSFVFTAQFFFKNKTYFFCKNCLKFLSHSIEWTIEQFPLVIGLINQRKYGCQNDSLNGFWRGYFILLGALETNAICLGFHQWVSHAWIIFPRAGLFKATPCWGLQLLNTRGKRSFNQVGKFFKDKYMNTLYST